MSKSNDDTPPTSQSDNIPIKEVVKRVGVTASSIVRWVKKDAFPKLYTLGGRTFFSAAEVDTWIAEKRKTVGLMAHPHFRKMMVMAMMTTINVNKTQ